MNRIMLTAALALAVGGSVKTLAGDAWAVNRFFGGGFDGYASISLMQTDPDSRAYMRFNGGSYDGWDTVKAVGVKWKTRGTLIRVL